MVGEHVLYLPFETSRPFWSLWAMDVVMAEEEPAQAEDRDAAFQMPWKVATIQELGQRAYLREEDGLPEWLWGRIHEFLGVQTDSFKFLKSSLKGLRDFLQQEAQVDPLEVRYTSGKTLQAGRQWKDHTLESRALVGLCFWTLTNKPIREPVKLKAFSLLQKLGAKALEQGIRSGSKMDGMVVDLEGVAHYECLELVAPHFVKGLDRLWEHCPGARAMWKKLRGVVWHGYCISTAIDLASFSDLLFFVGYLAAHPTLHMGQQNMWLCCGKLMLPTLVNLCGHWLDDIATELANLELSALPALKTRYGNVCKTMDPVNRMILLKKLQDEKVHRRRVSKTHDLQPLQSPWARHEHYLDCVLHARSLLSEFPVQPLQLSISFDPGNYDGKQISAGVAYNAPANKAGYLLNQTLGKLMVSEIDDSLVQKAKQRKLTRISGFNELRGLDAMLVHSLGVGIKDFAVPEGLLLQPLKPTQVRLRADDGHVYIVDTKASEVKREVGPTINLSELKVLVTLSDQGPLNVTSLNFMMYSQHAHLCVCLWDPYHRGWNDIKTAAKRSKRYRTTLELTCLFNTNYGPWTSSQWWFRKRAALEEFLSSTTISSNHWNTFEPLISLERRMVQPTDEGDRVDLLNSLGAIQNCVTKGPLVKLMRWFSFFECCAFWEGDFYATKCVLENESGMGGEDEGAQEEPDDEKDIDDGANDEKAEKEKLAQLKRRLGTYKLAPRLINPVNLATKEILMSVCRATWKEFAERARTIKSPEDVMRMNIRKVGQGAWKEELVGMAHCSLSRDDTIQHLLPEWTFHDNTLQWHTEMLENLLQCRAASLASAFLLPPMRYCHVLSEDAQESKAAQELAVREFQALLSAETLSHTTVVRPLNSMAWRMSPFNRALFIAHEEDMSNKRTSHAKALHLVHTKCLGDSRIIENLHQHGRDLQRSAKNDQFGDTQIMANVLRSGCLEERKVPMVGLTNAQKVVEGAAFLKEPIAKKLATKGHKLTGNLQEMMLPKSRWQTWPSPSPASLFQAVCATEWLMKFCGKPQEYTCSINEAWLSVLAKRGWFLANKTSASLVKVVASCEYAFLGWISEAAPVPHWGGQVAYTLVEKSTGISWYHITDLDEWLVIPTEPRLLTEVRGPVGWVKCGDPMSLQAAMCMEGCATLIVQQMKALVLKLGGTPPKPATKRAYQELLISMCLEKSLQAEALKKVEESGKKETEDSEIDSQFSEVLSDLGKDDGNRQDLKELAQKRQTQKVKRKLAARDKPVEEGKKKKKSKSKGKGKAKGKGKGKKDKKQANKFMAKFAQKFKAGGGKGHPGSAEAAPGLVEEQEPDKPAVVEGKAAVPEGPEKPAVVEGQAAVPEGGEQPGSEEAASPEDKEAEVGKVRAPFKKTHKSPDEILSQITPPYCFIGLGFNDWRFQSSWKLPAKVQEELLPPFSQKSMSKTFYKARPWKEALEEVHRFNWQKFRLVKDHLSLPSNLVVQDPGVIPQNVLDALEPIINSMEEPKKYTKK